MRTRLIPAALAVAVVLTGCQTDDPQPRSPADQGVAGRFDQAPAQVTPLQAPGPGRILESRLLTGREIKSADKSRHWGTAPGDPQTPFCGILSTRQPESRGLRMASFMTCTYNLVIAAWTMSSARAGSLVRFCASRWSHGRLTAT